MQTKRHYWLFRLVVAGLWSPAAAFPGCAPSLDSPEYGKMIYEVPKVPGTEKPYLLPKLDEVADSSKSEPPPEDHK